MNNLNKFRKSTVAILTAILLISIAMPLLVSTVSASTATISLGATTQGPAGTVITITGSGFTPNTAALHVTFGGIILSPVWTSGGSTDPSGTLINTAATKSQITVPNGQAPGQYLIVVSDDAGNSASATFTVTKPVVNISPGSGISGSTVYVSATGFFPGAAITAATLGGASVLGSLTTTATNFMTGAITTVFTVPSVTFTTTPPSSLVLTLTDAKGNVGTATYYFNQPSITLSQTTALAGSTVTVTGSGFASGATIEVAYESTVLATVTAQTAGTFSATITVPNNVPQGAITIKAYDTAATATNIATTTLTIQPAITLDVGHVGAFSGTASAPKSDALTVVKVTGYGFAGTNALTASWIGPAAVTNTLTLPNSGSDGSLAATTSVPAAFTAAGTYTLTVTDEAGNSATAQVVVSSSTTAYWVIAPASGPVGTAVTATYFGATTATGGIITVGGVNAMTSTTATVASYPTAHTQSFVIPNLLPGVYSVAGTGDYAAFGSSTTFTVTSASPSVTLASTSGSKSQTIGVTGSGFIPGSTLAFTIQSVSVGPTVPATVGQTGSFSTYITLPAFPANTYQVVVSDGKNTGVSTVTIANPTVSLSATTIKLTGATGAATRIYFNASGFASGTFDIKLGGQACTVGTTLMTAPDAFGIAYGSFTVPTNLVAGQQTLVIKDAAQNSYSVKLTVQPSIALSQTAVPAGNALTLTGYGFATSSKVSLALNSTYITLYTGLTAGAQTSGTGGISGVTFTIPAATAGGAYTITVSDSATPTNNTATSAFTVTAPTFTMTPNAGAPGTVVTVTGAGWLPGVTTGTISFNGQQVTSGVTIGTGFDSGLIATGTTFTVPPVATGNYTVTVSDTYESQTATFTVTTASIALNATTGSVGDILNITGSGFNPNTALTLTGGGTNAYIYFGGVAQTSIAAGYNSPQVLANGTLACKVTATNALIQGIPITVPATTAGVNTVTLQFTSPAMASSQTFTVQPKATTTTLPVLKGSTLTLAASGFGAISATNPLTATLNGITVPLTVTYSGLGGATATFAIPVTYTPGANSLVVTDPFGNTATTTVTIGTPSIASLSVTSGPAGTPVQVTGTGFYAGAQIFVSFDGIALATNPVTITATSGSFIAFITVPAGSTVGTHTITATDSNNNQATATFTVTSGSTGITVNQSTMQSSAQTTNGAGQATTTFTAGSTVKASFSLVSSNGASGTVFCAVTFQQGAKVYNMASTPAAISPTANIVSFSNLIPAGATGTWTATLQVYASDGTTPLGVSTLTFTVS
jgi:hypothetical protein